MPDIGNAERRARPPIVQAEDPLSCVAMGTDKALDQMDMLRTIALN